MLYKRRLVLLNSLSGENALSRQATAVEYGKAGETIVASGEAEIQKKSGNNSIEADPDATLSLSKASLMTSDSSCKLNILLHDSDTLGVNRTEISMISRRGQLVDVKEKRDDYAGSISFENLEGKRLLPRTAGWHSTYASSKRWTRNASVASCSAIRAAVCQRRPTLSVNDT